jgi:hypothetical protein
MSPKAGEMCDVDRHGICVAGKCAKIKGRREPKSVASPLTSSYLYIHAAVVYTTAPPTYRESGTISASQQLGTR